MSRRRGLYTAEMQFDPLARIVDNFAMSAKFPHPTIMARVLVTSLTLIALALAGQAFSPGQEARAVQPPGGGVDPVAVALSRPGAPEALIKLPAPLPTAVPATPTPIARTLPQWGQTKVDTPLRLAQDVRSAAFQVVPKGSYLKLLRGEGDRLQVYYAGDGDDHKPSDGWLSAADVMPSPAPKWVEVRHSAALSPTAAGSVSSLGALPGGAVLEVLGEQQGKVHGYYLGDGLFREPVEGWVDAEDLAPAGPLLVAEKRGVKLLAKADVQSLQSGSGNWLKVPYRTQLDGSRSADANCGPTSVGMVLQFFRLTVPTEEVRTLADRLQGTSDPDGGFAIEYLYDAVERFGLKGMDLMSGKKLKKWTLDDVRKHIVQGHPVIPQLRFRSMPGRENSDYGDDHYVVLTGTRGDDFIYNDSIDVDGPGYGRLISADDLKHAWGASYFPFAGFAVSAP